jgi:hypothetical protein
MLVRVASWFVFILPAYRATLLLCPITLIVKSFLTIYPTNGQ